MIKKILCPTDFSAASMNATEFAAKLAQQTGSILTLLNVQKIHISDGVSLFAMAERESVREAKISSDSLKEMCDDINKSFKISCNHEVIPSISAFENVVAEESDKYNLIVVGTNGSDSMYQFYFGSHSFRIAKKTVCPVLVVPETCNYKGISNIVFASDYKPGEDFSLHQLTGIAEAFGSNIRILHVNQKDNEESKNDFDSFCNIIKMEFKENEKITFVRIINEKIIDAIKDEIKKSDVDLIVVNMKEHGYLYRVFHKDLIENLTSVAETPVLIYHY